MKAEVNMLIAQWAGKIFKKILPRRLFFAIRNSLPIMSLSIYLDQRKEGRHYLKYRSHPIAQSCILYNSYVGAGMICNPYGIFRELLNQKSFAGYTHIWVISEKQELGRLRQEYRQYPNVRFISRHKNKGKGYAKYMATAKYIVENTSFPFYFSKREGQVAINTWHSITVKTLGFDMPNGKVGTRNMLRSFLQCDYIVSPNAFMTDIFRNSFKLQGLYEGTIIEEGHPRNDLLLKSDPAHVRKKLADRGIRIDGSKKVILYAPTWRGGSISDVASNFRECVQSYKELHKALSKKFSSEYQIIIKPHHLVYKQLTRQDKSEMQYVPQSIDTNELLSIVDVLISDYSSIYFDFMLTNRPIVFYIPDLEQYKKERDVYFKPEELPGPVAVNVDEICNIIDNLEQEIVSYKETYTAIKNWACRLDDGNANKRIIDAIFNNGHKYNLISDFATLKKKLLFNAGKMANNGVTESLLSLLNKIDYSKYDVSVCCTAENRANIDRLNKNVRPFVRVAGYGVTLGDSFKMQGSLKAGFIKPGDTSVATTFETEFIRSFGNVNFDYTIDYSGYGVFYPMLFECARTARRLIWQHNDLMQDLSNVQKAKGVSRPAVSPDALVSVYSRYDKIVSVSPALMEINRKNLSRGVAEGKYAYVSNMIDFSRIQRGLDDDTYDMAFAHKEAKYKFVTMGRLSVEKNHANLIRAFARFVGQYPDSALYIIGHGYLRGDLEKLINALGIAENVALTGQMQNPFKLMSKCDCFIFPSIYEGQGLVVLEARYLRMPIIISNYSVAKDVCVPDGQLVIGMDAEDIYQGMLAFANGDVPKDYVFDHNAYNEECYKQFETLLEEAGNDRFTQTTTN